MRGQIIDFKNGMTSKQIAMMYYKNCDSYTGEDRKKLDEAFDKAFRDAQKREIEYAIKQSSDTRIYCAQ